MIVGDGFIARAFKDSKLNINNKIIFASGVSNSSLIANNEIQFERELDLLKTFASSNKKLIYFSTSSIFDKELVNTPYIKHKLLLEKYIQESFTSYLIYRLPIVVGTSINPNTLTNYLYSCITSGNQIELHEKACRYLIDIEDVVKYVNKTSYVENTIINLNFTNRLDVKKIISIFEKVVRKKANIRKANKGDCYSVDNSQFIDLVKEDNISYKDPEEYVSNLIRKYYG